MPEAQTPLEEKALKFGSKLIAHSHLKSALEQLQRIIRNHCGFLIAVIVGPTGAGKTTLRDRIYRNLLQDYDVEMRSNPGLVPVISEEAVAPDTGSFHWGDFYTRILEKLEEPHVDKKRLDPLDGDVVNTARSREYRTPVVQRRFVEKGFANRGVKFLLVDEAQNLAKMASGRKLEDQMVCIRSLANMSRVFVVMFGTYDLLDLQEESGPLARCTCRVHLSRYRVDDSDDIKDFQLVLQTFQAELPVPAEFDFVDQWDYFYKRCAGCVGTLKLWLNSALNHAIACGKSAISKRDLNATALSIGALVRIAKEIERGEDKWKGEANQENELEHMLGLQPSSPPKSEGPKRANANPGPPVGVRNPTRDPAGMRAAIT